MNRFLNKGVTFARVHGLFVWLGAYIVGVLIARSQVTGPGSAPWLLAFFVILLILVAASGKAKVLFPILTLLAAMSLGLVRENSRVLELERGRMLLDYASGEQVRLLFRIDRIPNLYPNYTVLRGVVEQIWQEDGWRPVHGRLRLAVGDAIPGTYRGDRILAMASLRKPLTYQNPGGFDYEAYLARRGIAVSGWVKSGRLVAPVDSGRWPGLLGGIDRLRAAYLGWLRGFGGNGGALVGALVAGDRESLSPEVKEAFADTGLSHILAISGLHLGLVAMGFFFMALWTVKRWSRLVEIAAAQRAAAFSTIVVVITYAVLTGMRVPTQRALIMVLTYLAAVVLDRKHEVWNALALAAAIILFAWPMALYEASFQLSFVCVAGILYVLPRAGMAVRGIKSAAREELDRLELIFSEGGKGLASRLYQYLAGLFAVAVVAQWSIFPLQVNFFHCINPLAPLYNLVAVPVCGLVIIPLGLLSSLVAVVSPPIAAVIMEVPVLAAEFLVGFVILSSDNIHTLVLLPPFSWAGVVAWYVSGLLFLEGIVALRCGAWASQIFSPARRRWNLTESRPWPGPAGNRSHHLFVVFLAVLILLFAWFDVFRSRELLPRGRAVVAAIDVGHGQSLLVRTADERFLLVDGGGYYKSQWDPGKGVVSPCLLALGIRHLDAVILSHPHPDHARGLVYILSHFKVDEFWHGRDSEELTQELDQIAFERGIRVRVLDESSGTFDFGTTRVRVLHPPADPSVLSDNLNNRSLVLNLLTGGASILLTGDIEKEAEQMLVRKYGPSGSLVPNALAADFLSIPHHGSLSSSTPAFIEAVSAQKALVCASGSKDFGLPSSEVLSRYLSRGVQVGRTDIDGFSAVAIGGDTAGQ